MLCAIKASVVRAFFFFFNCLDQSTPLVTRDRDFRHFAAAAGLPLL
jgi:hypothetical protein